MIEGRKRWIWSSEGTKFGLVHQSGLVLSSETILPPTWQWRKNMLPWTMNFPSISCLSWSEKRCNGSCIPFVSSFLADYAVLFCYAPGVSDVFINSPWPPSTNRLSISTAKAEAFATASRWQYIHATNKYIYIYTHIVFTAGNICVQTQGTADDVSQLVVR